MAVNLRTVATPEEAAAALTDVAARFLRAGGVLRWSDWEAMCEETRLAFEIAGSRVAAERSGELADVAVTAEERADDILDEIATGVLA